jgi:hypothetical protein
LRTVVAQRGSGHDDELRLVFGLSRLKVGTVLGVRQEQKRNVTRSTHGILDVDLQPAGLDPTNVAYRGPRRLGAIVPIDTRFFPRIHRKENLGAVVGGVRHVQAQRSTSHSGQKLR